MERLKREPVTDVELTRAKNQIEAAFVFQEDSIHRRASLLARFELIGGYAAEGHVPRPRSAPSPPPTCSASPRAYFPPDKKNVGILLPKP